MRCLTVSLTYSWIQEQYSQNESINFANIYKKIKNSNVIFKHYNNIQTNEHFDFATFIDFLPFDKREKLFHLTQILQQISKNANIAILYPGIKNININLPYYFENHKNFTFVYLNK